jgi:hypothetical protein
MPFSESWRICIPDAAVLTRASRPTASRSSPRPIPGFGIVIATTDGRVYEIVETGQEFTIQSISSIDLEAIHRCIGFDVVGP